MIKFSKNTNTGKSESFCSSPYAELSKTLTLRRNALETNANSQKTQVLENQNHSALLHMLNFQRHWWGFPGLCIQVSAQLFANIAEDCPTICQHLQSWPNLLLTLPNCLPSMSYTGQLFASFAEHRPTVLPTSCHSDHQIKSVRFSFGFLFFPSVIV